MALSKEHKELLKRLKLEYIKKKAPGFFRQSGGYNYELQPYRDDDANNLLKCIHDFIFHQGGYVNRISTVGMMRKIKGEMKWTKGNSNKGAPDLRFIFQGKSGDIEIKIGKDRLSDAQVKEIERIEQAGGLAFVASDFDSFLKWWQAVGFTIPEFEKNIYNMNTEEKKDEKKPGEIQSKPASMLPIIVAILSEPVKNKTNNNGK